nr:bromodomain-containing protein 4A-like [Danaus plexippus plexippus]
MTNARNIKAWFCLVCMATSMAAPVYGPGRLQLDIIDMAAISRMTPQQLEALAEGLAAEEIMRHVHSLVTTFLAAHPVYGPPAEYASPSGYGGTAPAHFSHTAPAHTAPTGFAAHKYPSHIDGRGKLSGVHAGLVILTPLAEAGNIEHHESSGHTALEPPPSLLHTVYSAIKDAFSSAATHTEETVLTDQVPPPPQPMPPFKPMAWGAVNSYGEPADSYTDYDPRNPYPPYSYASSKLSSAPSQPKHQGLTQEKIQKINANLEKVNAYLNENQRSSEEVPSFNTQYTDMLRKGLIPFLPTPVVSDNEIGVLPGELLPDPLTTTSTSTTTVSTPKNTTDKENKRQKKDIKYLLRGNRILQV